MADVTDVTHTPHALRGDLDIGEPTEEGKVMISDPVINRHYLVSATTMSVLSRFDGTRTDEEVRAELAAEGLDVSPGTLGAMTAKAVSLGLFEGARGAPAPVAAHLRGPSRRSFVFFNIGEMDPSRVVTALRPVGRVLFSKGGALLLLALLVWAGVAISRNDARYIADLSSFTTFAAWGFVYVGNVVVTLFHEFGHALAVGRFGGTVTRMGLAVYLLSPAAFTDTSSAWAFPRTRHRVIVSLGGVYVEAFFLAAGVLVWGAEVLPAVPEAGLFILCHALLARIVFNLNPLLRLDGYWLLSDLLQIPNLRAKAFVVLLATVSPLRRDRRRLTFLRSPEERLVLMLYATLSTLALAVGLGFGFSVLDQLARRNLAGYGDLASRVAVVVLAAAALVSAWRYVRTLRTATFVRGAAHGG